MLILSALAVLLLTACGASGTVGGGNIATTGDVGCSPTEQLAFHIHAHLAVFDRGQPVIVPAKIGITPRSICWLHTHDVTGIVHIESPVQRSFTLGQFFQVWNAPLDSTHLLDLTTDEQHQIRAFVNGREFGGPPESIPLEPHAEIVLEYGPPYPNSPAYTWPPGF